MPKTDIFFLQCPFISCLQHSSVCAMKLSDAGELSLLEILRKRFVKKSPILYWVSEIDAAVIRSQIQFAADYRYDGGRCAF